MTHLKKLMFKLTFEVGEVVMSSCSDLPDRYELPDIRHRTVIHSRCT